MARNNARIGRLRRVLNEDQSSMGKAYNSQESDRVPGDTPRYGAGANIENHPQITDYIPRRIRIFGLLFFSGATLGILAEVVAHHSVSLSPLFPQGTELDLAEVFSARLIAWTSAVALLITAACARIVFLLKRHRIDDLKGRYRVWRTVSWLSVLLSANCVMAVHSVLSGMLGHATGWHLLKNDAGWWLLPQLAIGSYVFARLLRDASECRAALTSFLLAAGSFIATSVLATGWTPITNELWMGTLTRTLPLSGVLFLLTGCLLSARYVVLDVQGLIEHDAPDRITQLATSSHESIREVEIQDSHDEEATESAWIDGSQPEDEYDRPLTKAERKRLRKQQRHRAA